MVFQCDACKRVYELDRNDVRCVYCGEYRCHPVEPGREKPTDKQE